MSVPNRRHNDWLWPFSLVPRSWTAFKWGAPLLVKGRNILPRDLVFVEAQACISPKPVTSPGSWQLSRFPAGPWWAWYFAWSGKRQMDKKFLHVRVGARWDNVDGYVQFPSLAARRFYGRDIADDTSVR